VFFRVRRFIMGHYLKMLADFRKNVLDIIDFKYQHESNQDT
jgi:hypothetical protein